MPSTTIETDDLNQFEWDTITTTYDDDGSLLERETLYDSGLIERLYQQSGSWHREFVDTDHPDRNPDADTVAEGGLMPWTRVDFASGTGGGTGAVLSESFSTDTGQGGFILNRPGEVIDVEDIQASFDINDTANWAARFETSRPGDDSLEFRITYLDNGIRTAEHYTEDGTRDRVVQMDLNDATNWDLRSTSYDAEGRVIGSQIMYDNGVSTSSFYNDDAILYHRNSSDGNDAFSWDKKYLNYDTDGNLTQQRIVYDDGRDTSIRYSDGIRTSESTIDWDDAHDWEYVSTTYDADGDAAQRVTLRDNGVKQTVTWQDGVLTGNVQEDLEDTQSWSTISTVYSEDGDLVATVRLDDDGVQHDTFYFVPNPASGEDPGYEPGQVIARQRTDTADAHDWSRKGWAYDAEGDLMISATEEDDGDMLANYYENGLRYAQTFQDESGSQDWYAKVNYYDDTGAVASTEYFDSYADFHVETGFGSPWDAPLLVG